jgi:predicted amidohydrolase
MLKRIGISLVLLLIFIWLIWSYSGRKTPVDPPKIFLSLVQDINPSDTLKNNLVGIQPYMEEADFVLQERYRNKLELYLAEAKKSNLIRTNTLVVFPENIGTWLILVNEKHSLADKNRIEDAKATLIWSNIFDFSLAYLRSDEEDRSMAAIFRMKAKNMAEAYFDSFSTLAQQFQTSIVAGSIILPKPIVVDGEIYIDITEPLTNVSFIFGPDGKIIGKPIIKEHSGDFDALLLNLVQSENHEVFDLPVGKTSILLNEDAWYEDSYQLIENSTPAVIINPSFSPGINSMAEPWEGFGVLSPPLDVDSTDLGNITLLEAIEKYSLPQKINNSNAQIGMTLFLKGEFWDLGASGQPLIIHKGDSLEIQNADLGGVWSLSF